MEAARGHAKTMRLRIIFTALLVLSASALQAETAWRLKNYSAPAEEGATAGPVLYQPLEKASRPWQLCILYPHLKDSYWLSVNHGMVEEAKRLGVHFTLLEAGGYPNLARQAGQVRTCAERGADALIIGTVSYDGLTPVLQPLLQKMPVIAAINDIADAAVTAKALVPWREMGAAAAQVIVSRHPRGSAPVDIAWFPGPEGAGWVHFVEEGFYAVIGESSARVVAVKYGDTGREEQVQLIEELLDQHPDIDYLVGSGPMAEAAVSLLRARGIATGAIGIVSDYMTHAVHRGIRRGRILAAPSDFPVMQGRLAVEMAVRALEGSLKTASAGPAIEIVSKETIDHYGASDTLAPADFVPVFRWPLPGAQP